VRVLILNWRYLKHPKAGGAEVWTQRIGEGLTAAGHQVTVFTAGVHGEPNLEIINGVTVIRSGNQFSLYMKARRYLRAAHEFHDVVLDEVNTRPFFAFRYARIPVVTMFHQLADDVWEYEMLKPLNYLGRYVLEPIWLRRFRDQSVLALSSSTKQSLHLRGISNVSVITPGVDLFESSVQEKTRTPSICFLGRLVPSKRPSDAIRAFELFSDEFPDAKLYVIGDGPLRTELANSCKENVEFVGRVDSATRNELLARCQLLLVTSVREGWGMNVTEASVFDTLSIGYDVPGLRDSISMTKGILVSESVTELASAISRYFRSTEKPFPQRYERTWTEVCTDFEIEFQRAIKQFST
jgi:glycosyltransferase involved in cell wall biosynthesis